MPDKRFEACFVDSNVWLYAFIDADDPAKSAAARELVQSTTAVVSTQVVNEVSVNLLRRAGFSEERVRELIRSFYEKYRVVELTEPVLLRASGLRERHSLSYWDGLILAAALEAGVGVVCTEDMQDGLIVEGTLRIMNPFAKA
jgi:predicted nucleic acid-binding protein